MLNGKVACITGAAGGIGTAVTGALIKKGVRCILADINVKALAGQVKQYGDMVLAVRCDITDSRSVKSMVGKAVKTFGGVDILVNNAGIIIPHLFEDCTPDEIRRQVEVNFMGPVTCTQEIIPHLKKRGGGSIITISSLAGIVPETYSSVYTATKFALRGFFLTLHIELKKHNIHVGTIFPDSVNTPMLKYEADHGGSPLTFLGTPQKPGKVADAVVRAVVRKKAEVVVPASQGLVTRLIMVFPWLVTRLWPVLEKQGAAKKEKMKKAGII